jgi:two-component system CheB/CheR fusion protein
VLDVIMQGVDGIQLAGCVRNVATEPIFVLAVTGVGTTEEVARVKADTFDHVFLKPVDPDDLLGLLDARGCRRSPVPA